MNGVDVDDDEILYYIECLCVHHVCSKQKMLYVMYNKKA